MSQSYTNVQVYDRVNETSLVDSFSTPHVPNIGEYVETPDGKFRVQNVVTLITTESQDVRLVVDGEKTSD